MPAAAWPLVERRRDGTAEGAGVAQEIIDRCLQVRSVIRVAGGLDGLGGLAAPLIAAGGALLFAVLVQDATLVQERVRPAVRGRVFAARHPMQALGYLASTGLILAAAGSLSPRALLGLAGALFTLGALGALLLLPGSRELWRAAPPP